MFQEFRDNLVTDLLPDGLRFEGEAGTEEAGGVAQEFWILHLLVHIQHEFLVGGGVAGHEAEIAVVGRHDTVKVQFAGDERCVNIEEVTAFEALIEGADFRPDQLVQLVCEHFALAAEPIVFD